MTRPSATGLATAFFRFYLLEGLAPSPARPAALLAKVALERMPFANGAFGRALQSLIEGGHVVAAPHGAVALSALGAAERLVERERWSAVVPVVTRFLGEIPARPEPEQVAETPIPRYLPQVAEAYLDGVLVATVRERLAAARDGGRPFCVVLGVIDLQHGAEAQRRAMLHRAIRATLGGAATLFGGEADVYRFGDTGIALVSPLSGDPERGEHLAVLVRARLEELLRSMSATVRAFGGARWNVRAGCATWSPELATSAQVLRIAEQALATDGVLTAA